MKNFLLAKWIVLRCAAPYPAIAIATRINPNPWTGPRVEPNGRHLSLSLGYRLGIEMIIIERCTK